MLNMLVIADDLTGALDTGVQFARRGIRTMVIQTREIPWNSIPNDAGTLCVNTETRHLPPDQAYEAVYRVGKDAYARGIPCVFKKIDSTMRGQVGAEIAALADASGSTVGMAPAFPKGGRTTEKGVQMVSGVPIHETVFGSDPFEPITQSDVKKIIASATTIPVVLFPAGTFGTSRHEREIELYDAKTDEDMASIARHLQQEQYRAVVGCAGLAGAWCRALGQHRTQQKPDKTSALFAVCGSMNPISEAQIAYAVGHGFVRLSLPTQGATGAFIREMREACAQNSKVLVIPPPAAGRTPSQMQREEMANKIGQCIYEWLSFHLNATLMVTGGDTLSAFLHRTQNAPLYPICQLQPGVVVSRLSYQGRTVQVVSKAGGFGQEDVYETVAQHILA